MNKRPLKALCSLQVMSIIALLLTATTALTPPKLNATPASYKERLRGLENMVWTADPDALSELEYEATRIIQENPYSAFGHYLLAYLYLREFKDDPSNMGKLKKASELGQQATDLQPESSYGYLISALVLDIMGYTDNALRLVDPQLNTKISKSWRTNFLQAQLLAGSAEHKTTLTLLSDALRMEPSAMEIIAPYAVAILRDEYREIDAFKSALLSWSKDHESPIFEHSLAIALSEAGRYKDAVAIYESMLKKDPNNVDARINLGILLSEHLSQPKKGKARLVESQNRLTPADTEKHSLVMAQLAKIALREKSFEQARELFKKAILASPAPLEWLTFTHAIYNNEKRYEDLSLLLSELKKDLPGNGVIYAIHGELLSEHLVDHSSAIESYQNAILLEPNRSEFYNGMGLAYYRLKDLNKALSLFNHATKVDPRDATARYNEACVLAILGYSQRALGSLREAISLDPRLQLTAREDSDFNNLRSLRQFEDLVQDRNLSNVSH